jgi:hypothetical protein
MNLRALLTGLVLAATFAGTAAAQSVRHLTNGIEASNGSARPHVTALTDSILRVRVTKAESSREIIPDQPRAAEVLIR